MKQMKNPFEGFVSKFREQQFWPKLRKYARQAGIKTVYSALLLFFAYRRKDTPAWAKNIVLGTLGYFLAPFDAIPDLSPIIGYTDDIGVLSFGLVTIAAYINKEVRQQAREKLTVWFGEYDEEELKPVDDKL
ncbi:MAG: YkvA family protein [Bacteroidota bacterium]